MELTKAIIKEVASLDTAKGRRETGCFKAEGTKCVADTLGSFELVRLLASAAWLEANQAIADKARGEIVSVANRDFARMSHLSTAPSVIAVYRQPQRAITPAELSGKLALALDGVQDPGNLGTIMRTADWFGIHDVIYSADCADPFSPKAVMSTMGAISRVKAVRCNLAEFIAGYDGAVFGTSPRGENIYRVELPAEGLIVMGSEGHGMTPEVDRLVTHRLMIPPFAVDGAGAPESLNVAAATAIIISEFRRRWQS